MIWFSHFSADVDAISTLKGTVVEREGKKFLEYNSATLKAHWKPGRIKLDNLFNGDKNLGLKIYITIYNYILS